MMQSVRPTTCLSSHSPSLPSWSPSTPAGWIAPHYQSSAGAEKQYLWRIHETSGFVKALLFFRVATPLPGPITVDQAIAITRAFESKSFPLKVNQNCKGNVGDDDDNDDDVDFKIDSNIHLRVYQELENAQNIWPSSPQVVPLTKPEPSLPSPPSEAANCQTWARFESLIVLLLNFELRNNGV